MKINSLTELENARNEIIKFSKQLDEKKIKKEITDLEYKILMTEKLHGQDQKEFLQHIDQKIATIEEKQTEKKNKAIAMALTTLIILTAFASTLYLGENDTTGHVIDQNHCQSKGWQEHNLSGRNQTNQTSPIQECSNPVPIKTKK